MSVETALKILGLNTDLDIDDTDYCKQQIIDEIDLIKENYKE